jgi:hypothetical protein
MHTHDMFGSHGISSGNAFFRGQLSSASGDHDQAQGGQPQEGADDSEDEVPDKARRATALQKRERVGAVQLEDSEDEIENPIRGGDARSKKKKRKVNVADATVSLYEAVGISLCAHRLGLSCFSAAARHSALRGVARPCESFPWAPGNCPGPLLSNTFPAMGKGATLNSSIPFILMLLATACDCSAEVANAEFITHLLMFSFVPKATSD